MYSNIDDPESDYETIIDKLSKQITKLYNQIQYYQVLVTQQENQITKLLNENNQLKAQIQNISLQPTAPSYPSQQSYTPSVPKQQTTSTSPSGIVTSTLKRVCPNCGASGFAIREEDDKSKIISYIPRRIYAKKRVCTKCRFEF
ncbi:MAG: hypothetical protein ACFFAQ_02585 [Promethearchaeota archaeon]